MLWAAGAVALLCALVIGFLFVLLTPAKQLIPGYYRPSEREASEVALLRIDSIRRAYERNDAYLSNILTLFDTDRAPLADSLSASGRINDLTPDSLLPVSAEESKFAHMMQQREKFNITVMAPLAAEGMLFYPVCESGVVTADSRESEKVRMALPDEAAVMALADGAVMAVYGSPFAGGYSVIMQHPNGFASRYSGLGTLFAGQGDLITGGQIIGLGPKEGGSKPALLSIEIWHNGNPLLPYKYISDPSGITVE